jgi:hypothetical protein
MNCMRWGCLALLFVAAGCGDSHSSDDAAAPMDVLRGPCDSDRDCSALGLICDRAVGVCGECSTDAECAAGEACLLGLCDPTRTCTTSRECPGLVCDAAVGRCVECVDPADCPSPLVCRADGRCAATAATGCTSDGDCAVGVCDIPSMTCVECLIDGDCTPPETCRTTTNTCENPTCGCVSNADCDDGLYCNGEETCASACAETCTAGTPVVCPSGERCDEAASDCVPEAACTVPLVWFRDADGDGYGTAADATVSCEMPAGRVRRFGDCDDGTAARAPGVEEVCDGLVDDDCDAAIDEGCACTSGTRRPCGTLPACAGEQTCSGGTWGACGAVPATVESCNGRDDDCDGMTDEAPGPLSCGAGIACTAGRCATRTVRSLAVRQGQSFALYTDGAVRWWGSGPIFPTDLTTVSGVVEIRGEAYELCMLLVGGRIVCSTRFPSGGDAFTMVATDAVTMSVGLTGACYVRGDGHVLCWGSADRGQLGPGVTMSSTVPVEIPGITNAIEVSSGLSTNCALLSDGRVMCWGGGEYGMLGAGIAGGSATPRMVVGVDDATDLAGSTAHTCVERPGGLYCWGLNADGALGDGTVMERNRPVAVEGLPAGARLPTTLAITTTCVITATRTVLCLGHGTEGQLGDGRGMSSFTPVEVSGLTNVESLVGSASHWCALTADQEAYCWGSGPMLELGDGVTTMAFEPVRVAMLP